MICVGTVSVLTLRWYAVAIVDDEVSRSLDAFIYWFYEDEDGLARATPDLTDTVGQPPGNVIAVVRDGSVSQAVQFTEDEPKSLPGDAVAAIQAQSWQDGPPRLVRLGSLGWFRAEARVLAGGETLVSGGALAFAHQAVAGKPL